MTIAQTYKPFNFSETAVYVVKYEITHTGATKIETHLPVYIKKLKGICFTANPNGEETIAGYISLTFNEGALKNVQLPVMNSRRLTDVSHPIPINEQINSNSMMQGYFLAADTLTPPFRLSIYLHYER